MMPVELKHKPGTPGAEWQVDVLVTDRITGSLPIAMTILVSCDEENIKTIVEQLINQEKFEIKYIGYEENRNK